MIGVVTDTFGLCKVGDISVGQNPRCLHKSDHLGLFGTETLGRRHILPLKEVYVSIVVRRVGWVGEHGPSVGGQIGIYDVHETLRVEEHMVVYMLANVGKCGDASG
jgi:hypothetical protein